MTFNEKLIRLRKINSLTQDEFAKSVGVSRQAVYKWEWGKSLPTVDNLYALSKLFGVTIENILVGNDEFVFYQIVKFFKLTVWVPPVSSPFRNNLKVTCACS